MSILVQESLREDLAGMEITQQVREEKASASDADKTLDMVEETLAEPEEKEEAEDASVTEEPDVDPEPEIKAESSAEPGDDSGDDEDAINDEDSAVPATESIRNSVRVVVAESVVFSNEGFKEHVVDGLKSLAGLIRDLGVTYGPKLFSALKTGAIKAIEGAVKLTILIRDTASKALRKYKTSMSRHLEDIDKLKDAASRLSSTSVEFEEGDRYRNPKVVQWARLGNTVDFKESALMMKHFMVSISSSIDAAVSSDLEFLLTLMKYRKSNQSLEVSFFFDPKHITGSLKRESTQDFEGGRLMDKYTYPKALPRNVKLVAILPNAKQPASDDPEQATDQIVALLKNSSLILTNGGQPAKPIEEMPYMSLNDLLAFIDQLEELAKIGNARTSIYESIEKAVPKVKSSYQGLLERFLDRNNERENQTTFRYIMAKQAFISNVYLTAALDIHEYLSNYLTNAKRFVSENIKVLASKHKSENNDEE